MAKKANSKKKAAALESVIVGSKVKAAIKSHGCMTSGELLEALNSTVHSMIKSACSRAQGNKRATVRAHDL